MRDHEFGRLVNESIANIARQFDRIRDAATVGALDLSELATFLDEDLKASIEDAKNAAIARARNLPPKDYSLRGKE